MKRHFTFTKERIINKFKEIITLEATPNALALGVAIGILLAFIPLFGLEWLIVILIIFLVKDKINKVTLVAGLLVSNPFTALPMNLFSYWVGRSLVGGPSSITLSDAISAFTSQFASIAYPWYVGSLVTGLAFAVPAYLITYYFAWLHKRKKQEAVK